MRRTIILILFCFLSSISVSAQTPALNNQGPLTGPSNTTVTAAAGTERVRFTAPSHVVRMQPQGLSESGQILFDVSRSFS